MKRPRFIKGFAQEMERSDISWLQNLTPSLEIVPMFYFYVLKSNRDGKLYWGYTDDLRRRVKDHNSGRVISTKDRRPLELVYYEAYKSEKDARERERQIKQRAKSFISLKRRIKNSLFE